MALTKITGQVINTATDVTVGVLTVTNTLAVGGTVSIGGTLTYEDVTNVDAIGIITARSNILVGSGITLSPDGNIFATGISTAEHFHSTDDLIVDDQISVGGNVSIADKIVHTGDTNTAIRFPSADTFTVETGGSEGLRVDSSQLVQINTSTGNEKLNVAGAIRSSGSSVNFNGGLEGAIVDYDTSNNIARFGHVNGASGSARDVVFLSGGSEKARITSAGKVGISTASADARLHVLAGNEKGILIEDNSVSNNSPYLEIMAKRTDDNVHQSFSAQVFLSRNRTEQKISSGLKLGTILFGGNHTNGSKSNIAYPASIAGMSSGDFNSVTDMPTDLVFFTGSTGRTPSTANVSSGTEKLRIDKDGHVLIPNDNAHLRIGAGGDLQLYHDTTGTAGTVIKNITGHLYMQSIGDVKIRTVDSEIAVDCQANGAVHLHYDGASDSSLYTRYDGLTIRNNNVESGKDCNVDLIGRVDGSAQLHMYADDNTDNNKKFQIKASNGETMDFNSYYTGGWDFHMRLSRGANNSSNRKVQIGKGGLRFDMSAEDYRDIDGDGHLFRRDGQAQIGVDDFLYIHDIDVNDTNNRIRIKFDSNAGVGSNSITCEGGLATNTAMDFAEYFEWSDGNPSNEDRVGHTVSIDGLTGKIKIAEEGETVIGAISGTGAMVAGAASISWNGRFKRDEWGREIYEQLKDENGNLLYADAETRSQIVKTNRIETSEYDSSLENSYVPRELRKEWDIVGLLGQIRVRKTAVIPSNWVKLKEIDSVKDLYLVR